MPGAFRADEDPMHLFSFPRLVGAIVAATLLGGCGAKAATDNDVSATAADAVGGDDAIGGSDAADSTVSADIGGPVAVTEEFWVTYQRHERVTSGGADPYNDLVLTAWKNSHLADSSGISTFGDGQSPLDAAKAGFEFTKSSFKIKGLSCAFGCCKHCCGVTSRGHAGFPS